MISNDSLCILGGIIAVGLSAVGSAIGIGKAACSAIGAWKKCYAQGKAAPYILFSYVGAPLTQTLYGMVVMFLMFGLAGVNAETGAANAMEGAGFASVLIGLFAGAGIGASAIMQGAAAAASADAQAETGKGLANNMGVIGVVETVAIFVMVFAILAIVKLHA